MLVPIKKEFGDYQVFNREILERDEVELLWGLVTHNTKNDLLCTQFIYRSPRPLNSVDVERGYKKRGTRVISGNHISWQRHPMMSKWL